ncbi:MAG: HAD-IA family hydrolase [Pseudomonadota bacterium]
MLKAILFGSIGTIVETSDLQRDAFNAAFAEAGVPIRWSAEQYADLLLTSGGRKRIEAEAQARGLVVDATALHSRKSQLFQERLAQGGLALRPGVGEVISEARARGLALGFVTTTSRANVDAILTAVSSRISAQTFDFIGDETMVEARKPAPDIFLRALHDLGIGPDSAVAIEDSPESVAAAVAAGVPTIALPGAAHHDHYFDAMIPVTDRLTPALLGLARAAA